MSNKRYKVERYYPSYKIHPEGKNVSEDEAVNLIGRLDKEEGEDHGYVVVPLPLTARQKIDIVKRHK